MQGITSLHEYCFRIIIIHVVEDREHDLNSKFVLLTQDLYDCHTSGFRFKSFNFVTLKNMLGCDQ